MSMKKTIGNNERRNKITKLSKYQRNIKGSTVVDVYDVLKAFDVHCPAVAHGLKKLLCPGTRGVKDRLQDLKEAKSSIDRAIELEENKC